MKRQKIFRVIAALPLGAASGRKILNGIYRFLGEGYMWDIELVRRDNDFASLFRGDFAADEFDGMVVAFAEDAERRRKQANIDLPTVFVDYPDAVRAALPRHAFVQEDEAAIAETAAEHLLASGSRASFAFVPSRAKTEWSDRRQSAFAREMKKAHRGVRVFGGDGGDRDALAEWIMALPKPASILAAFDDRGADVLEACRRCGLSVPSDVAVLGIGNDEPICDAAVPPLSSVDVEFAAQGYRAARELHALMLGGRNPRVDIRFGASGVVARASTVGARAPSGLAIHAMEFIRENALRGISARDVVEHLRVSRRLADMRFREAHGKSMLEAILEMRLGEAKRLLAHTGLSVSDVASRCGFRSPAAFRAVFKRHADASPRSFRR